MNTTNSYILTAQPDQGELVAKLVSLFCSTVLSVLFGLKTFNVQFKYLSYSKWIVLVLYIFSWSFTVMGMLLVTTNNGNFTSCLMSIMVCDVLYCAAKITIYVWLIEKIYVVSASRKGRWNTLSYKLHISLLFPYIGIFILMITFHIAEIQDDGTCIIGLRPAGTIPLLVYDFGINLYMTILFIKPLMRMSGNTIAFGSKMNSRLHEVALRTLVASVVCLVVSFANIFALVMLNGRERGLVCMTCCTVDVTVNVITVHWVTTQAPGKRSKETEMDHTNMSDSGHDVTKHQHEKILGFKDIDLNIPHYSTSKVVVEDQRSSSESALVPSYQDSHTSRKTLTKQ
ncbi:hypothetical protein G6F57_013690 [Rhizopus arrhizus]|uniref:Uncharacterized protein n=1 Tax=Rhizopus oryzae TaxID=64495 RepID=A0A9P7BLQ6_RHIOR|nr:hypothetical protein G6F24_012629 [Rhizopus arrhizus]KAG0778058.1 hypothetical protein G6F22_011462 [Rhizopus arrhizus]KAG0782964.1 hypothetical protein G6F21_010811 [Rhizopus arrhizus]KAG0816598.1 hypothetical protein G6F20_003079 [Rhizopus arrhizus]KAG0838551.1 hypothetical protein G6F19_003079 [Rhizopus arrhizus]